MTGAVWQLTETDQTDVNVLTHIICFMIHKNALFVFNTTTFCYFQQNNSQVIYRNTYLIVFNRLNKVYNL